MKSIRTRLLAAIALIVIVSGLAISQSIIHRYRTSLHESAAAQAQNVAQNLALSAEEMILLNDIVALQRLFNDRRQTDEAVAYLFVVHEGQVLAHTFANGIPGQLLQTAPPGNPATGTMRKIESETGERFLDVSWPISEGRAGMLRMGYAEAPFEKQVNQLWLQVSIMTFVFVFIAAAVGLALVRQITRPLVLLTEAASSVDETHLEIDVPAGKDDEVGRLKGAFNQMLARLKKYTARLEENTKALEKKNLELERAQQQTRSLVEITRGIGALAGLKEICSYLDRQLCAITSCRNIAMIIYPYQAGPPVVFSGGTIQAVDGDAQEKLACMDDIKNDYAFIPASEIALPVAAFKEADHVGVIPFFHEGRRMGVLCIGCGPGCACMDADLQVIKLVLDQSSGAIQRALAQEHELLDLKKRIDQGAGFSGLIGKAPQMQVIYKLIEDVAPSDATVLIEGESGTGKEMVARAIHENSPRSGRPFVVINCSAYPATLLESELFGHEKGAFTGAVKRKPGRFEQADGGTIFLDEIGDIPLTAQVKLLRVLQSRKFERLGGDATISVDIRILAATNKGLLREVKAGNFREDLYYRLNVIPMHMPPLRERKNDIPILARHFLRRFSELQGKSIKDFDSGAMRLLLEYPWPGNVRELENTIEHAVVLSRLDVISAADFPSAFAEGGRVANGDADGGTGAAAAAKTLEGKEKTHLVEMLEECGWNKKEAARRLNISRSTLYAKLKRYGIKNS